MASTYFLPFLLFLCVATGFFAINARADNMAIYYGYHNDEAGSGVRLRQTCETGLFSHVSIAFLSNFGNGRSPTPDLGSTCNGETGECKFLQKDIAICQRHGVKVLLSIGGMDVSKYTLASAQDAHQLAAHIYNVYLSGFGIDGPLGKVKLDGVDFFVNDDSTSDYWDVLAQDLKQLDGDIVLTASQGCNHTAGANDMPLYNALRTGMFNKAWPRFYGRPCTYQPKDQAAFKASVESWATDFSNLNIYLGLVAHDKSPDQGFISPDELPGALQIARQYSNFGGVMLWNRHLDLQFQEGNPAPYSAIISPLLKERAINIRMRGGF